METAAPTVDAAVRARLTLPPLREESLKIGPDGVTRGRYLLTFSRRALLPGPAARFRALANDLGLDAGALVPHLPLANAVHVGFEPGSKTKLYLEFPPPFAPEPNLAFLAIKHDKRLNRYVRLSAAEAEGALSEVVPDSPARDTARGCLAKGGVALEVTEEGSQRRSIDIHLADAAMTVADIPGLGDLLVDQSDQLTDIRHETLGHFACGRGRDGAPFATIYYGGRHDP